MTPPSAHFVRSAPEPKGNPDPSRRRDRALVRALTAWFHANQRDLPWRRDTRDPYHAVVSEAMLQQTQASRVAERFAGFIDRFPSFEALAGAPEEEVLAAWSGLGYYRRARNLHKAAQAVVERHAGACPSDPGALRALPGVGAYTAGAIASIVFGVRTPLVDANVSRIILRLEGRELDAASTEARRLAWRRAEDLVRVADDPGACNEALMELGALVCKPRSPDCAACPLSNRCAARAGGTQSRIPSPRARRDRPQIHHAQALIRDARGRILLERRPDTGMWAGMWQAPTLERAGAAPTARDLATWLAAGDPRDKRSFTHATTHRMVVFHVWRIDDLDGAARRRLARGRRWVAPGDLHQLPLATPQRKALGG